MLSVLPNDETDFDSKTNLDWVPVTTRDPCALRTLRRSSLCTSTAAQRFYRGVAWPDDRASGKDRKPEWPTEAFPAGTDSAQSSLFPAQLWWKDNCAQWFGASSL